MRTTPSHTTVAAALLAVCLLGTPGAWASEGLELHARFDIAPRQAWGAVRITAADWHVGSAQGTPATAAELRAVLSGPHSLAVGGRCAGWVDGATTYPCGFAVDSLKLDGRALAAGPLHAFGWESTKEARERSIAKASPEVRAAGLIAPLPDEAQFVGITVRRPGDSEGAPAPALSFRIRALSNAMVPSIFERGTGAAVLRVGPAKDAVPND